MPNLCQLGLEVLIDPATITAIEWIDEDNDQALIDVHTTGGRVIRLGVDNRRPDGRVVMDPLHEVVSMIEDPDNYTHVVIPAMHPTTETETR